MPANASMACARLVPVSKRTGRGLITCSIGRAHIVGVGGALSARERSAVAGDESANQAAIEVFFIRLWCFLFRFPSRESRLCLSRRKMEGK
jgi:hypothetical protein